MLQQAVRTIFGPSNREVGTPAWMSGAVQLGGLSLTYNRIAIVIFAFAVFAALLLVLRYTSLGLYVRAVTQNRRMAGSMGIRTNRIDALAFGLGSGVAGIAGVALSQIDNVSPNLGQSYIIDSFLVVVFGGVGNLWGTLVGAMTLGIANKLLEPYAGAVLGKIVLLVAIILFIQRRPRGLFALKGQGGRSMNTQTVLRPQSHRRAGAAGRSRPSSFRSSISRLTPALRFHLSDHLVPLFGKYLCFALLALSVDLIWGFCGILSLGHGAFFALGGYAMGMYLMRQIGPRGVYADPDPCRTSWCS